MLYQLSYLSVALYATLSFSVLICPKAGIFLRVEEAAMKEMPGVMRVRLQKGRILVKRGDVWYLEECSGGRQTRRSLATGDLQEATRRAASGLEPPPPVTPKPKAPDVLTLGKALEEYTAWYAKNRRSSGRALAALDPFVHSVGEECDVKALAREHVQKWIDSRVDGRSALTVRSDFARVRAFVRWIAARKDVPALYSVCRGIDQPKDEEVTREAPPVEKVRAVLRKLHETHPWMGDFVRLLAETGARPSELLGLRGCDVRGKLVSIVPWEGRGLKSRWSKRTIEVNDIAAEILARRKETMLDKTRPIFATPLGTVYKEASVSHLLRQLLAGGRGKRVPAELDVTLYDMRHFFASEHAAPGPAHMSIENLSAHLGHSPASLKVLLRWYADQNSLRRGAAVSVLGEPKEGKVIALGKSKS